jgi:hypothetical protein
MLASGGGRPCKRRARLLGNDYAEGDPVALDQSKVGQHVASQMEAIEADYGEESEIGDICTIVEIRGPHGSHVRMRSTASSPHSTLGLLKLAEQVALANFGRDDL